MTHLVYLTINCIGGARHLVSELARLTGALYLASTGDTWHTAGVYSWHLAFATGVYSWHLAFAAGTCFLSRFLIGHNFTCRWLSRTWLAETQMPGVKNAPLGNFQPFLTKSFRLLLLVDPSIQDRKVSIRRPSLDTMETMDPFRPFWPLYPFEPLQYFDLLRINNRDIIILRYHWHPLQNPPY